MKYNIVTLEIGCFSYSIGGEHYYGSVKSYIRKNLVSFALNHPLSEKEAKYLSKKEECRLSRGYKAGDLSERFSSRQEVIDVAISNWNDLFPEGNVLQIGSFGCADPQEILVGPATFKTKANKLYKQLQDCGGYERNEELATDIFRKYQKLLK